MIKNFILTFLSRCGTLISGLLNSIITAHYLGPSGRGEYFLILTITAVFVQLGSLGMQNSNVYIVAKSNRMLGKLVINALWISVIIGIISTLGAWIIQSYKHGQIIGIYFLIILVPTNLFYLLGSNLLIAINKIKLFNLFQIGNSLAVSLAAFGCGLSNFNIFGFLTATSCVWLISVLVLFFIIPRHGPRSYKFNLMIFKKGFNFGIKTYISTICGSLVLRNNIFLLKIFCPIKILGFYSVASQISDALVTLPITCALLLFPNLVQHQAESWKTTKRVLFIMALVMIVVYSITGISAQWLIPIIFGYQFKPAVDILLKMLPGSFCLGMLSITSQYLASYNFPKTLVLLWIISLPIAVTFGLLFIPTLSGAGAAIAFSITYFCIFLMVLIFSYRFHYNLIFSSQFNNLKQGTL